MNLKRKREATTAPQLHILELQTALQGIVLRGTETAAETLDTLLLLTVVEELKVHVANALIQNESERVVPVVTVEGVTRATGELAVDSLADPAATVQMEHPVITKHTLAARDTHEKAVEHHAELHAEPAPVLDGDAVVGAPRTLLTGNTALADNNQICHFVRYTKMYNGQIGITSTYRPDIFLRSPGAKPMNRIFLLTERPAHLGEVHPNTGTVTLERYHITVNARELYQTVYIFHRTRNTKKEKPP